MYLILEKTGIWYILICIFVYEVYIDSEKSSALLLVFSAFTVVQMKTGLQNHMSWQILLPEFPILKTI